MLRVVLVERDLLDAMRQCARDELGQDAPAKRVEARALELCGASRRSKPVRPETLFEQATRRKAAFEQTADLDELVDDRA